MAMLSKGSVALAPMVMLLIVWWRHRRVTRQQFLELVPFFCVAVLMAIINAWYQMQGDVPHASPLTRLAGAGTVVWFYLSKALFPFPVSFNYPQWRIATNDVRWWLPLCAAVAVTATLIYRQKSPNARWSRSLLFGWGFYGLALIPVMGFAEVGGMKISLVADHYLHFAIIGVVALVAAGWSYWRDHVAATFRQATNLTAIVVVAILAVLGWRQSRLFGSPVDLYEATLALNHDPYAGTFLHNNIAIELADMGRLDEAIQQFQSALTLTPEFAMSRVRLGEALLQAGRPQQAIEQLQRALQDLPNFAAAQNTLGVALRRTGRTQEAIEHFQRALELRPSYPEAHFNLGNALVEDRQLDAAIKHYQEGLQLAPDNAQAHCQLANALRDAGRSPEAMQHYQEALRLQPDYPEAQTNLLVLMSRGAPSALSLSILEKAAHASPNSFEAVYSLALAQLSAGNTWQAKENFELRAIFEARFCRCPPDARLHIDPAWPTRGCAGPVSTSRATEAG